MDLPTYTNIWRIEKRLYKLYDLRLPMPLPLGQIIAFAGITVPYVLFLTLIGIPFNHNLFWLYVLPPWALTWLATRPVLENKRLPELLASQVRYLSEPSVWCRMAPATEQEEITVTGKVWHAHRQAAPQPAAAAQPAAATAVDGSVAGKEAAATPGVSRTHKPTRVPAPGQPQWASTSAASKRRSEARHRRPASAQPQATAGGRVMVPQGPPASLVQQRGHGDPVFSPGRHVSALDSRTREPAAAPSRSPRGPARPTTAHGQLARGQQAPVRGQQPEWAKRARPGSWPAETPKPPPAETPGKPRVIEVSHAEQAQPEKKATPAPSGDLLLPFAVAKPSPPPAPAQAGPPSGPLQPVTLPGQPPPPVPGAAGPVSGPIPSVTAPGHSGQRVSGAEASANGPVVPVVGPVSGPVPPVAVPGHSGQRVSGAEASANGPVWPVVGPVNGPVPPVAVPEHSGQQAPGVGAAVSGPARPGVEVPGGLKDAGQPVSGAGDPVSDPVQSAAAFIGPARPPVPEVDGSPSAPARPYGPARPDLPGKHSRQPDVAEADVMPLQMPPVQVARSRAEERPARTVERVLGGPAGPRGRSWHERVTLVPGGHGPGRPGPADQEERDKARARLPLPGPRRVVVLGCTSGAGQTVTTLLVARLLASLRGERVGVLDLNPGEGSLVRRAKSGVVGSVHDLLGGMSPAGPGLELISGGEGRAGVKGLDEGDFGRIGDLLAQRYAISLVDPGASAVGRVLAIADQLVLVAPASSDAPRAVSMTREWLETHDHRGLAANAIMVLNGVSGRSMADVESAEAIVVGRCRAIVRVPWEDQLGDQDGPCAGTAPLRLRARQALTALTGVLVSGLAAGAEVPR
ncbi:MAG TPA: TcpE family conjugal transfer membrane protein [Streptosporangiaceae bacterium]|nr:TcpE family conjugal transfer membrane protein [Streptosporangiaceae bacterium]